MFPILRAVLVAALILLASGVQAQTWSRWSGREVDTLRIEGIEAELATELRRGLALAPRDKLIGRDLAVFRPRTLEADLDRARLWLAREGYPQARLEAQVHSERDRVRIVLRVEPGPRTRFGTLSIEGLDTRTHGRALPALAPLRDVTFFRDALVEQARAAIQASLYGAGYARAVVHTRVTRREGGFADIVFTAEPGAAFVFGEVVVSGVAPDLEGLAYRVVRSPRGESFRPAVLTQTRDDLRALGLFRQVRVATEPADSTTLNLVAELSPRPMRTLEASIGTWSDYPIQARTAWRHRNLFGRGRGLTLHGAFALRRQEVGAAFGWPALLSRRSLTEWRADLQIEEEEAYLLRSGALRWTNLFRVGRKVSWRAGLALLETSLDVRTETTGTSETTEPFDVEPGQQLVLEAQWYFEGVDDPLDPTRGWRLLLEGSWAPSVAITDAPFLSGRAALSRVQPVPIGSTLASRIDLAWAGPLGDANDLLPSQRWFAGGFNTMRGASRRGLGPTVEGDPVGGEVRVLAGLELRVPLRGMFGMTMFADSGQVWSDPEFVRLEEIATAVGGGLLVRTPIGPVHLELAHNVGPLPEDGVRSRIQFGIGHPF